ncbi:MAG TPA: PSD1 and planctomycete cytochrome C domain-containing protein [Pirellulaceae bacterium]|nr:PSD1 and planctomycete cytochrome C domain-containing protein [Pirellulaceae bacterium]
MTRSALNRLAFLCALAASCAAAGVGWGDDAATAEQEQFFETQVRPLLAAKCLECHGDKKQESGLRLDSRATVMLGGDSGSPAVIPGKPDESLLISAVKHKGDIQMPPTGKLTDDQIAALTKWVEMGSPWPKSGQSEIGLSAAERVEIDRHNHWALKPVARPEVPECRTGFLARPEEVRSQRSEVENPIDAFIWQKLAEKQLAPSPPADRRTLLRRVSFDLIGLPPTADAVDEFVADDSPDAYERRVDRLLASPRFGERWGRHWLDVARYGDTKGYAFMQERRYPYAYTYRDYVIAALNADKPYDQFVIEQLAADKLPLGVDNTPLAAMGFLTTGRKFNDIHNDIDDQIDVVTRGLLGLTVACARCHDHKYDAIPTEDYYSLHGVFNSSKMPEELPLIGSPREGEEYRKFEEELKKRQEELTQFDATKHGEILDQVRQQAGDYMALSLLRRERGSFFGRAIEFLKVPVGDVRRRLVERWRDYLTRESKPEHAVLGLWAELSPVEGDGFAEKAKDAIARFSARPDGTQPQQANPHVKAAFAAEMPTNRFEVARIYGKVFSEAYVQWRNAGANAEAPGKLSPQWRQLAEILLGPGSPTDIAREQVGDYVTRDERQKRRDIQKKIDSFTANSPVAPPRAMVLQDNPQPNDPVVFIRGNPARPGKQVPRQMPAVVEGEQRHPFADGGRLELARAIVSRDNPLTRRVIVNRLWMHHFGEPLVLSPSDFGIRTAPPTHPELLDWLAMRLLDSGWSLKDLHRRMVGSSTYRQVSGYESMRVGGSDSLTLAPSHSHTLSPSAVDPENRLLWRMNRRRLELEAMRDSLLCVSGELDLTTGGRSVEMTKTPYSRRRAVYGFIDRQDLPNFYRVFDIASPDQSSPRRPQTTVPQQALYFMNSPFVVERAKSLAALREVTAAADPPARIQALYRQLFQRPATSDELDIGVQFLAAAEAEMSSEIKLTPIEQYAHLLLLTNEGMYVD